MKVRNAAAPGGANTFIPALGKKKQYDDGFHTIKGVPIFDAHSGADEGLDVDFDGSLLERIVEQCNHRIADTGDLIPVTDRHTSDNPRDPEPEILGYAVNFRMGKIGKLKPRPAIYADLRIHKHKMSKVKTLPRRSIELWPDLVIDPIVLKSADRPAIDSVALLGGTRPARDLGLLFQKSTKKARYRRELQVYTKENMNPEEIVKQCVEAISSLPEFQWIRDKMKSDQGQMEMDDGTEDMPEDETQKMGKSCYEEEPDEVPEDEDKLEPAKLRMQRDQAKRRYARLESEHKALFDKVAAIERTARIAERKADLMQIEAEGYAFDMSEELETVGDMDKAQFSKHLSRMKKNYRKAPVNVSVRPAAVPAEGGLPVASTDRHEVMKQAALKAQAKYNKEAK